MNEDNLQGEQEEIIEDTWYEPVFVINQRPTQNHVAQAQERNVPVVVITTNKLFNHPQALIGWKTMNIPPLEGIMHTHIGDHSFLNSVKDQIIQTIKKVKKEEHQREVNGTNILEMIFEQFPPCGQNQS